MPHLSAKRLEGKVILITGASVGIGRAAALRFAAEGATVILTSRNIEPCQETAGRIAEAGGSAISISCDVSIDGDVARAVDAAEQAFGRIDGAFNNAGVQTAARPMAEHSVEEFDWLISINLRGMWLSLKAEIPALVRAGGGAIVNTTSVGGLVAAPGIAPYITSKHGIVGLTKAAALDYGNEGIRVNAIAPGATGTAMFYDWLPSKEAQDQVAGAAPLARVADPAEIAGAAAWLLSDDSSFVTGAILPVEGGYAVG